MTSSTKHLTKQTQPPKDSTGLSTYSLAPYTSCSNIATFQEKARPNLSPTLRRQYDRLIDAASILDFSPRRISPLPATLDSLGVTRAINNSLKLKNIRRFLVNSIANRNIRQEDMSRSIQFLHQICYLAPNSFTMPVVGVGEARSITMYWKNGCKRLEAEINPGLPIELFALDLNTDRHWDYQYSEQSNNKPLVSKLANFFA